MTGTIAESFEGYGMPFGADEGDGNPFAPAAIRRSRRGCRPATSTG
jgi:hypothetical protein